MARLPVPGSDDGVWGQILNDFLSVEHNSDGTLKASGSLATKQPLSTSLTTIAGLTPADDDLLQQKAGAWTNRTPAQVKTDLAITKADVGLANVDNTSDATKNSATAILTNKSIIKRVSSIASSATPTPNADTDDVYIVSALAAGATFGAPTGTPTDGQSLIMRIKDDGTPRSLAFNAVYRFSTDLAAPAITVANKTLYMGFVYNAAAVKWDCLSWINNF